MYTYFLKSGDTIFKIKYKTWKKISSTIYYTCTDYNKKNN